MIRVFEPKVTFSDKLSILKTLSNKEISGSSSIVKKFESQLADTFNRKYAVSLSNGSVALDVAFQLLDLKKGDEVILPSFTIVSCLSAVIRTGATPVFCEIDSQSWNMNLENVKRKWNKKTKAVLIVHTYGLPAEAKKIKEFCIEKNIYCIEDAAEAHGQSDENILCGSFGDLSTLSFYANKHISTGEGGAVLTDSSDFDSRLRQMINLDFQTEERFKHENMFWNYRLGGLQAALGSSQIKNLEKTIIHKENQGQNYQNLLHDYQDILQLPLKQIRKSKNQYWVFGVVIKKEGIRNSVIRQMYSNEIETRPFFFPLHMQPFLRSINLNIEDELYETERIGFNGLYLPLGSHISFRKQKYIVKSLIESIQSI